MLKLANRIIEPLGFVLEKKSRLVHSDMEPAFFHLYEKCRNHTMTSVERMYAIFKSIEHVASHSIPGDVVECGVWKGGSAMMAAHSLLHFHLERQIYLYDTFEGMSDPTDEDVSVRNEKVYENWDSIKGTNHRILCYSTLEEVQKNLLSTGYPENLIHFVKGLVEETIPGTIPHEISLLRLDTDWYESTKHEMLHLYPKLVSGGILILDDYGHWQGAQKAVDEYFNASKSAVFLHRTDYTGRTAIKP